MPLADFTALGSLRAFRPAVATPALDPCTAFAALGAFRTGDLAVMTVMAVRDAIRQYSRSVLAWDRAVLLAARPADAFAVALALACAVALACALAVLLAVLCAVLRAFSDAAVRFPPLVFFGGVALEDLGRCLPSFRVCFAAARPEVRFRAGAVTALRVAEWTALRVVWLVFALRAVWACRRVECLPHDIRPPGVGAGSRNTGTSVAGN